MISQYFASGSNEVCLGDGTTVAATYNGFDHNRVALALTYFSETSDELLESLVSVQLGRRLQEAGLEPKTPLSYQEGG